MHVKLMRPPLCKRRFPLSSPVRLRLKGSREHLEVSLTLKPDKHMTLLPGARWQELVPGPHSSMKMALWLEGPSGLSTAWGARM